MNQIRRMAAVVFAVSALSGVAALAAAPSALPTSRPSAAGTVEIVVDGRALPEYRAYGTRYVEALKGRDYAIRVHNPFDVRVAVALSVDGLSTIDARHTTAAAARKWVIGPHETITIFGWQTSMAQARRFFFTTEDRSYAERLGQPENQGVISAVFFKERAPVRVVPLAQDNAGDGAPRQRSAPAGAAGKAESLAGRAAEEYTATGIGERADHRVQNRAAGPRGQPGHHHRHPIRVPFAARPARHRAERARRRRPAVASPERARLRQRLLPGHQVTGPPAHPTSSRSTRSGIIERARSSEGLEV